MSLLLTWNGVNRRPLNTILLLVDDIVEPVKTPTSFRNPLHVVDATKSDNSLAEHNPRHLARNIPAAVLILPEDGRIRTDACAL